mmetsp:Transcript_34487/g.84825  ORF Transcript_34487/g.84825 Transcript_34487/m.84825 type:complete len:217 (+) Transcript_34487:1361-2011(+)
MRGGSLCCAAAPLKMRTGRTGCRSPTCTCAQRASRGRSNSARSSRRMKPGSIPGTRRLIRRNGDGCRDCSQSGSTRTRCQAPSPGARPRSPKRAGASRRSNRLCGRQNSVRRSRNRCMFCCRTGGLVSSRAVVSHSPRSSSTRVYSHEGTRGSGSLPKACGLAAGRVGIPHSVGRLLGSANVLPIRARPHPPRSLSLRCKSHENVPAAHLASLNEG